MAIPCTDYRCPRQHITRRSGPIFANYHPEDLPPDQRQDLLQDLKPKAR
jgi:hypothetical protein